MIIKRTLAHCIDRKGFVRVVETAYPPPPTIRFPVMPRLSFRWNDDPLDVPMFAEVRFSYRESHRRTEPDDIIYEAEYRED